MAKKKRSPGDKRYGPRTPEVAERLRANAAKAREKAIENRKAAAAGELSPMREAVPDEGYVSFKVMVDGLLGGKLDQHIRSNVEERLVVRGMARESLKVQVEEIEKCRRDIHYWIRMYVWQENPNLAESIGPFVPWGFQTKAIDEILEAGESREDLLVEKSRDMGATWIFLLVDDWLARFHKKRLLAISKSSDAVDHKSLNSLFGKVDFIHKYLPDWMLGSRGRKSVDRNKMYFGFEDGGEITGEASTGRAGVSGRAYTMFIDEFSQVKEDWEVYHRTAATTGCRMFNGTHMGMGTAFYALSQNESIRKLRFHWTQHPRKNQGLYRYDTEKCRMDFLEYDEGTDSIQVLAGPKYAYAPNFVFDLTGRPTGGPHPGVRSPWYDKEFKRIGENESEMAKDQDINPKGSVAQFYQPLVIRKLKDDYAMPPLWEGDLEIDVERSRGIRFVKAGEKMGSGVASNRIKLWLRLNAQGLPPTSVYGLGADVSQGVGNTASCISICNGRTGEKVLQYVNASIYPNDLGTLAVALGWLFVDEEGMPAKIIWEHVGPGATFGRRVWDELDYRNLYFHTKESNLGKQVSDKPGWNPTSKESRLLVHSAYREALYNRRYLNRSGEALDETLAFKHIDGSVEHSQYRNVVDPAAARENHGDIVIPDVLSWWVMKDVNQQAVEKRQDEESATPFSVEGRRKMRRGREELQVSWR